MRNHSHNSRNMPARIGGCPAPRPGRKTIGARNSTMNPASSNIPSDWEPANSPAAATNDRNATKHANRDVRGKILKTTNTDPARPIQHTAISMCELLDNQNSVGAYQNRAAAADFATVSRYSEAGSMPSGPMSPRI